MSDRTEPTGQALYEHLKETGTGESRLEKVASFLKTKPSATCAEIVEHLILENVQPGTIQKAGQFVYGDTYSYRPDGSTPASDEIEKSLRSEIANLKRESKEKDARLLIAQKRITQLQSQLNVKNESALPEQVRQSEQRKREPALAGK